MPRARPGENLKKLREGMGLSLREFAALAQVQASTIHRWEHGEPPAIATVEAVADACKVSTDWLLGRSDRRR